MAAGDSVASRNDPRPGSDRKLRLAASSPNIKAIFDANPGGPASSYPQQYTRLPSVVNQPIAEYVPPSGPDPATAGGPRPPLSTSINLTRMYRLHLICTLPLGRSLPHRRRCTRPRRT